MENERGQKKAYNDAIEFIFGYDYCVGCTTVAMAQVIAYHYSKSIGKKTNVDENCWNSVRNWSELKNTGWTDKKYDWNNITSTNSINNLDGIGKVQLQTFLYEVSQKIGVSYGTEETNGTIKSIAKALKKYNFSNDGVIDYSFNEVQKSINNGCPVIIKGGAKKKEKFLWFNVTKNVGHAWVIDGWSRLNFTATNNKTNNKMYFYGYFLHCNLGWYGTNNGYYYQGIFDMQKDDAPIKDGDVKRSAEDNEFYFNYDKKIIVNIK